MVGQKTIKTTKLEINDPIPVLYHKYTIFIQNITRVIAICRNLQDVARFLHTMFATRHELTSDTDLRSDRKMFGSTKNEL